MWEVLSWVCLVWSMHFVFFPLRPQPWPVLLLLLPQPLPVLLLHWYLYVHLLLYVYVLFLFIYSYMRLLLLTQCSVSCLSEGNTGWFLYVYLLLLHESNSDESESECVFTCAHDYIESDSALQQTTYMTFIGYTNYMMLGVLVMCILYTSILITKSSFRSKFEYELKSLKTCVWCHIYCQILMNGYFAWTDPVEICKAKRRKSCYVKVARSAYFQPYL